MRAITNTTNTTNNKNTLESSGEIGQGNIGFDLLSESVARSVLACDNSRDKCAVPKPILKGVFISPIRSEMKTTPVILTVISGANLA